MLKNGNGLGPGRLSSLLTLAPLLALAGGTLAGCGNANKGSACAPADRDRCYSNQQVCAVDAKGAAACQNCGNGTFANKAGQCENLGQPTLAHEFQKWTVMSGQEIRYLCQSWTLNNPDPIFVTAVEMNQDEVSHHSIWTFVPDDHFVGPDGTWTCTDRNYDEIKAALDGGVLYAQSTQAEHEVQKLPNGSAIRIPPYSRIISDIHLLNATLQDVTGSMKLKLYAADKKDVRVQLVPFQIDDRAIHVLPQTRTRLVNNCQLADAFRQQAGAAFTPKIHYLLPHTHGYGTRFYVNALGGTKDGESILDLRETGFEAHGRAFDPPFDLTGATGITVGCEYINDTDKELGWGWSFEMCQMLGYTEGTIGFEGTITDATQGAPQQTDQGMMHVFVNNGCDAIAAPWDFNAPGGPGPATP